MNFFLKILSVFTCALMFICILASCTDKEKDENSSLNNETGSTLTGGSEEGKSDSSDVLGDGSSSSSSPSPFPYPSSSSPSSSSTMPFTV